MNVLLVFLVIALTLEQIFCAKDLPIIQEKSPEILFCNANREIRVISLNESLLTTKPTVYKRQTRKLSRSSLSKPVKSVSNGCNNDIDYDISDNYLIWSNISSIIIAPLDKRSKNALNISSKKVLLKTSEIQRVSLDWIHDLLYYIENGEIKVINTKNQKSKTISDKQQLNSNYYNAIDIVVNPLDSFIAYIRWDRRTFDYKLMKADQSGANPKILLELGFYGHDSQTLSPCCLSIDYESKRIYFIDNKLQTLESILFDGSKRSTHLHSSLFSLSNSLDIYGDYVFWSNRGHNAILSTDKYGKSGSIRTILKSDYNIDSIRIKHNSRQPVIENRCQSSKCSNLCIPAPNDQYICVCDNDSKRLNKNDCNETHYIVSNITIISKEINKIDEISAETKTNEIVITENYSKSYPLYVFKCETVFEDKTNESSKTDWFGKDGRKLSDKFKKSPLGKNITRKGNYVELKVSYPYIKALDAFTCKTSKGNQSHEANYKVIVRQMPFNPKILSHSLSFAGISKVYLTLQIENMRIDPPIDKYRIVYRGIFNYYQQENWVDFNALLVNENDKNTIYIVKLDMDYTTQDLMAFKLYAHNEVGWSYPLFN